MTRNKQTEAEKQKSNVKAEADFIINNSKTGIYAPIKSKNLPKIVIRVSIAIAFKEKTLGSATNKTICLTHNSDLIF